MNFVPFYGLAALLVAIGLGFACLPDAWIESWFGFSPDNGNDLTELLLAALPIAVGLGLGTTAYLRQRRLAARLVSPGRPGN